MTLTEIVLRTAATLQLSVLAAVLLTGPRTPVRAFGALSCAGVAAFVLTSIPGAGSLLGPLQFPLTALCVAKAAFFWLFARSLFDDAFRPRLRHAAACVGLALYGTWQQLLVDRRELDISSVTGLAVLGFDALVLLLVFLTLAEAWRGFGADLVERRRRLRVIAVTTGGAYLAIATVVQGHNLLTGGHTPALLFNMNVALIFGLALVATVTLVQRRATDWLTVDEAGGASRLDAIERQALAALQRALDEAIYRKEGLTIGGLAQHLRVPEYVLRRVINRGLGFRNFNDFLHTHRIREACDRLGRPEQEHLPVLTIALDVGYGSVGPFNRAFKARMGMTPTAFRRASRDEAAPTAN